MKAHCLIPARSGSRRIPGKNIKLFHGKPIIAYSIEVAIESELFDDIIVSTDSAHIADVVGQYGAGVHMRSAKMSQDEVGTQEVAKDYLRKVKPNVDLLCVMYATAPMITIYDLACARRMVVEDAREYAFTVGMNPLHDAGQFYFGWANAFAIDMPLIGSSTAMIPVPTERDCDINTQDDWDKAEKMYDKLRRLGDI